MSALSDPDSNPFSDEEEIAEFRRAVAAITQDHRRVLAVLVPRLVALQDRGDAAAALRLIAEIKRIVTGGAASMH